MRGLIIQESSSTLECFDFRESLCIKRAFNHHGIYTDVWGKGFENFSLKPEFNNYDFILNCENYDSGWVPDLSAYKKPFKMLWSIDAHCKGAAPFENEFKRGEYNLLLQSTKDFVTEPHHHWFPNSFCDDKIKKLDLPKENWLSFVGNYVNRKNIIDSLENQFNLKKFISVRGDKMVEEINKTHIHFNMNISVDLNYRHFETIGCGTCLLTSWSEMAEELGFKDGENVIFFKSIVELYNKLNFYKRNPEEISKIADAGYKLSKKHSYKKRVLDLIEILKHNSIII